MQLSSQVFVQHVHGPEFDPNTENQAQTNKQIFTGQMEKQSPKHSIL